MNNYIANITKDGKTTERTISGSAKIAQEFHKQAMKSIEWGVEEILEIFDIDSGMCVFRLRKGFLE